MIKIENTQVVGWEPAIRGMRNPKNSWDRMDSDYRYTCFNDRDVCRGGDYKIGPNDHKLMMSLAKGGPVHAKYRRYIDVYVDITAPLYWWKEFDTYRTAFAPNPFDIEENSCSTMHKLTDKEFTLDDFSHEHLFSDNMLKVNFNNDFRIITNKQWLIFTIELLNEHRRLHLEIEEQLKNDMGPDERKKLQELRKQHWWQIIQLLPSSYNQKRTVKLTYETCAAIYPDRKNHKQDEWRELCKWIESLPYSEIITGLRKDAPDIDEMSKYDFEDCRRKK